MYDIRVIRDNKNVLVNYINAFHVFSKNLMGPLLEFMSKIKYFYQNYKRERIFEKSRECDSWDGRVQCSSAIKGFLCKLSMSCSV